MSADYFDEWASAHAVAFGIHDERDLTTILSWRAALGSAKPAELREATTWMLLNPTFLTEDRMRFVTPAINRHLLTLVARIADRKAIHLATEKAAVDDEFGTCDRCGGTGWICGLPHRRSIVNGEWVAMKLGRGDGYFYTEAVTCMCGKGQWVSQRRGDRPVINFAQYVLQNPGWELQLANHTYAAVALGDAVGGETKLRERLDSMLADIGGGI